MNIQKADSHAQSQSVELNLEQLIACQYWLKETPPLPNKKTKAHLVGGHLSAFKGRGMEFSEVRQYQAGDDIRTIDWRVTARTGKVHTKIFQEERERPVFLVVDLQDSMFFGSRKRFKSTQACIHAARAFWAAHNSGNRVGALLSTANQHLEIKPSNRRKDGLRLMQKMLELHNSRLKHIYQQQTDFEINPNSLRDSLIRLRHLTKGGSLIYILSDFYNLNDECTRQLNQLSQHNDIYNIMLTDPLEQTIPVAGQFALTNGQTEVMIDSSKRSTLKNYQQHFEQRLSSTEQLLIDQQCFFRHSSTADEISALSINPLKRGPYG